MLVVKLKVAGFVLRRLLTRWSWACVSCLQSLDEEKKVSHRQKQALMDINRDLVRRDAFCWWVSVVGCVLVDGTTHRLSARPVMPSWPV